MRSLRARLAVVWVLSALASIALAVLMSQLYAQSASANVANAEDRVAGACDQIRDAWRYYDNGWNGPAPRADDPGFRADLRAVLARALDADDPIAGGVWLPGHGLLASQPLSLSALPSMSILQAAASSALQQDHDVVEQGLDHGDTVVVAACILSGPVPNLVAWSARRLYAARGLSQLRLGFAVLLGLVLAITGWLTWLVMTWSRHVRQIEAALVGHSASGTGGLPRVAATGERELDRIIDALNTASTRLDAARREATTMAARVADGARLAALGRVAAGVAHEIRNPIASMRLRAENALAGDDQRRRKALGSILGQITRLDRLLGELLAMTQSRVPAPEPVDLGDFLRATLRDHEDAAQAAGVALHLEAPEGITVPFDPALVGRVLANLLENAIRATPTGGQVFVAGQRDVLARQVRISVADDGPGVAPGVRGQLFEPFVTGRADGTGLGLAIARELVTAHGGTLALTDRPAGSGACFTMTLPAEAAGASTERGAACPSSRLSMMTRSCATA
ncbi:sensor histidine kinase [Lichenicola sp.]|uniref:sensor histidine kinase n=1 Tax=Lichenicola sp. TaxID=2804529 RepID=UPI003B008823